MSAAETQDGSACRPDAANDDAAVPETWESRVAGLKQRIMARIVHGMEQAAGRPPACEPWRPGPPGAARRHAQPQRIDRPFGRRREATVQTTGEVLIVTTSYRFRAVDRVPPEELDGRPTLGPAQIDSSERLGSRDGCGIHGAAGTAPEASGTAPAAPPSGRSILSEIAPGAERPGEGMPAWTVEIVLAYLAKNAIDPADLPKLISDLNNTLRQISEKDLPSKDGTRPAVPIAKSVTPDYIICLEDGRRFKSMKRHLKATYNLTPEEYRDKWGLLESYPMIAPNYARRCSDRAKAQKLGRRPSGG